MAAFDPHITIESMERIIKASCAVSFLSLRGFRGFPLNGGIHRRSNSQFSCLAVFFGGGESGHKFSWTVLASMDRPGAQGPRGPRAQGPRNPGAYRVPGLSPARKMGQERIPGFWNTFQVRAMSDIVSVIFDLCRRKNR